MTSETEVAIKKLSQTRQQTQIILCLLMGGLWKLSPSANWFQILETEIVLILLSLFNLGRLYQNEAVLAINVCHH